MRTKWLRLTPGARLALERSVRAAEAESVIDRAQGTDLLVGLDEGDTPTADEIREAAFDAKTRGDILLYDILTPRDVKEQAKCRGFDVSGDLMARVLANEHMRRFLERNDGTLAYDAVEFEYAVERAAYAVTCGEERKDG